MPPEGYRFVPNSNAKKIICQHLHDVEVMGPIARFIPVTFHKDGHDIIGEQCAEIYLPTEAVGPAIALTWQRMPSGVVVPAVGHLMRHFMLLH